MLARWIALPLLATTIALTACGGDSEGVVPGSFHIEATFEESFLGNERTRTIHIRWWHEPPGLTRVELEDDDGITVIVAGLEYLWFYLAEEHAYSREPIPEPFTSPLWPIGIMFGPQPEADIDAFIAARIAEPDGWAERVSVEELQGRTLAIIEFGPLGHLSTVTRGSDGTLTTGETGTGKGRVAIDTETMFILRSEIENWGERFYSIVATLVEFDLALPDELFAFEPPEGAQLLENE